MVVSNIKVSAMYQTDPPRSARDTLPTMYDLPSEEAPGLPDEYHLWRAQLLSETFCPPEYPSDQFFVASDLNLYYDSRHTGWYKRPDWFAVVDISRLYEQRDLRLSYVVWQEGINPLIAIEFLSPGTEREDLGQTLRMADQPPTKWEVYERILRIPYYVVFDRYTDELRAFQLQGDRYAEVSLPESKLWIATLKIGLGLWQGTYRGIERQWLRWYDSTGAWIPCERERTKDVAHQLDQERQRVERLIAQLRTLGAEPELGPE